LHFYSDYFISAFHAVVVPGGVGHVVVAACGAVVAYGAAVAFLAVVPLAVALPFELVSLFAAAPSVAGRVELAYAVAELADAVDCYAVPACVVAEPGAAGCAVLEPVAVAVQHYYVQPAYSALQLVVSLQPVYCVLQLVVSLQPVCCALLLVVFLQPGGWCYSLQPAYRRYSGQPVAFWRLGG
jgi:hypothetical protein